jgi:chromosome segregation ATPase
MARTLLRWGGPFAVALLLVAVRDPLSAQGSQGNSDVLTALLAEVRGLRAAMEQMASAGPRVQLAMGRLQLQEQRVNTALRKLDDLHSRRTDAEQELAQLRNQVARTQEMIDHAAIDSPERQAADMQLKMLKDATSVRTTDLQRLAAEEADASAAVAAEQGRWTDINQKLEELERALARR